MNNSKQILLPGLNKQLHFLEKRLNLSNLKILVIGSGSTKIAESLNHNNDVEMVVEDYESLMKTKFELSESVKVPVKIMDYENTDYKNETFDLIFAQASISDSRRKKIITEIKRISKPSGYLCVGELVKLQDQVPNFVMELFNYSNLNPLSQQNILSFYKEINFQIIDHADLSNTLREFYEQYLKLLKERLHSLSSNEKSYYKKILNQVSHESNAYLKLGADKFIGFTVLLLKHKSIL